ncbi:MAG: hypothetical protein ABL953_05295 [Ilumatobacteraceae bacterium]
MGESRFDEGEGGLVLVTPRKSHVRFFVIDALFVSGGVLIAVGGSNAVGWLVVGFFGLCLVVETCQLIAPGRLVITPTDMEVRSLGRHWSRDLASCTGFKPWRNPFARQTLVGFDHPLDVSKRAGRVNTKIAGCSGTLPETYGMNASELATLLEDASKAARASATKRPA